MKRYNCKLTKNHKGLWTYIYHGETKTTITAVEQITGVMLHNDKISIIYPKAERTLKMNPLNNDIFDALIWARHENGEFREHCT